MDDLNLRDKMKTLLSLQYELLGQEGKTPAVPPGLTR